MRACWLLSAAIAVSACSSSSTTGPGTGIAPPTPTNLLGTSLNAAVALTWDDNAFLANPSNFQNYRVFSTSYTWTTDYLAGQCGTTWQLEGTTVSPEFLVGVLTNGVSRCFAVSAMSVGQAESPRSTPRNDTPRPDARNVVVYARQVQDAGSGFRFWKDLNSDGQVQANELGLLVSGVSPDADFTIERDPVTDSLFFQPQRAGVLLGLYNGFTPVADLTSIDLAPDPAHPPTPASAYSTAGADAIPGVGYVFQMPGGGSSVLYGAVRPTHVGDRFIILEWSFQTDPDNPELRTVAGVATHALP
jgi:hypothetical protein